MNKQKLMDLLEHPENLPERAFTTLPSDPTEAIYVMKGEYGYWPLNFYPTAEMAKEHCDHMNKLKGVSEEEVEALTILSFKKR